MYLIHKTVPQWGYINITMDEIKYSEPSVTSNIFYNFVSYNMYNGKARNSEANQKIECFMFVCGGGIQCKCQTNKLKSD